MTDEDTNSILTDNANRAFQGNVAVQVTQPGGQLWNQATQVTLPDNQILQQIRKCMKKCETDFKKYCKSEVDKYMNISIKIWRAERADLVDMCPDFDFFLKRLDV